MRATGRRWTDNIQALESRVLLAAPKVIATTPLNGKQSVSTATKVTVKFDQTMLSSSINTTTIELRDSANDLIPTTLVWDSAARVALLTPTSALPASNQFVYVNVNAGATGVKNSAGEAMATDFHFGFSTGTAQFNQTTVFSGLEQPTAMTFSPDGRVFVAEKSGLIKVFDSLSDTTPDIFADLRTQVYNYWDRGLLGLTLDPKFTTGRPYVYVLYTYDADIGGTAPKWGSANTTVDPGGPGSSGTGTPVSGRLSRLTASGNSMTGTEQVLINDWAQQFPSHSIGDLKFGPDGYLYASAGDGGNYNSVDYGQFGNIFNDPTNEGGSLRSQDMRTTGDPASLDGSIIRIDPDTGAGANINPFGAYADANARRIISEGLRNPYRFTFKPGSKEMWIGDVGWGTYEEINRIPDVTTITSAIPNFGWPAYEGPDKQPGFDAQNLPIVEGLYADPTATALPFYAYKHSERVVAGSGESTGGSSVSGLMFYSGANYPSAYDDALFFSDYTRKQIYIMYRGVDGLPDISTRQIFKSTTEGSVQLLAGPNGDLFSVELYGGAIRRYTFDNSNSAPTAVLTATPSSGNAPLTVHFDGSASSDPDAGDSLDYSWDLNGDGTYGDSTVASPTYTYPSAGVYTVRLRVTDRGGLTDTETLQVGVDNHPPVPTITLPTATTWTVGQTIAFAGSATDAEDGTLAASAFDWSLELLHDNVLDPSSSHIHFLDAPSGVKSGTFVAPDHGYPTRLRLVLTVTDASGLQGSTSVTLQPSAVTLVLRSIPAGIALTLNGDTFTSPADATEIANSVNSLSAPASQTIGGVLYSFQGWSNGGARTQDVTAPMTGSATLTASYVAITTQSPWGGTPVSLPGLVQAENYDVGGEGISYNSWTLGSLTGLYRPDDDMDVEFNDGVSAGNGLHLRWLLEGEWVEYTVNVATTGTYDLGLRMANTGSGAIAKITVDGFDVSGNITLANTGSTGIYSTINKTGIPLNAGQHVIRLVGVKASTTGIVGNIDWMKFTRNVPLGDGLKVAFFDNPDFTGAGASRVDPNVNYTFVGRPTKKLTSPDTWSGRWTGQILAPATGLYTFYVRSDGGERLSINNTRLIDKWIVTGNREWKNTINLVAGQRYDLALDYFHTTGNGNLQFSWSSPSLAKAIVPQANLFSTAAVVGSTKTAVPRTVLSPMFTPKTTQRIAKQILS